MFDRYLRFISDKGTCVLCGDAGHRGLDLCQPCWRDLPTNSPACERCALPLPPADHRTPRICGRCQRADPPFDSLIAPYRYEVPCDFMVKRLKFSGALCFGRLIGELLVRHLNDEAQRTPELIVPVPLHSARLRQRGFNQSAQIAIGVAAKLGCKLDNSLLCRTRDTVAQMDLPANQRKRNVRDAFRVGKPVDGARLALIDDVVTTTSTVSELARVLKRAGAAEVQVWSFARVAMS